MEGDVELEERVLVLRRIRVHYRLTADAGHEEAIERAHRSHREYCPVYRSIRAAIEVTTSYELRTG